MTAPVRIEAEAWSDLRFATLARLMGFADLDHALIKVGRIWSWQAEHYTPDEPTYVVDSDLIESALGTGGAAAMVRARLAEEEPGGFRIRGTHGRIEWLWQRRQAAAKGGEARKRSAANKAKPSGYPVGYPGQEPGAMPEPSPLVPALVPDQIPDLPPGRAIQPSTEPVGATPSRDDAALRRRQEIRAQLWSELAEARRRVAAELELGPAAGSLLAFDPGEQALAMRILGARDDAELEQLVAQARHAIAVATAEARAERSVEWLTGVIFESDRVWRRLLGARLEDVGRGKRAGPRGSAERAPEAVRKIKTL